MNAIPEDPAGSATLAARDLRVMWHPCTQMKDHETLPMVAIRRACGAWLEDFDGKRYLDAVSSWWVNLFGHANPRINAALAAQLGKLEQVIFAGFTHEPAVLLAERLVALAPPMARCFLADNGSAAVEVAIKMSFHYWRNKGLPRKTRFMTLQNSYHGETLGALAVGNVELYKTIYKPLLMDVLTAPSPDCCYRDSGESWESFSLRQFVHTERLLAEHSTELAAVIVEPLVQCAGGMRMYDHTIERYRAKAAYLGRRARELENHPHVSEVRQCGMILAVELAKGRRSREPYPRQECRGQRIYRHSLKNGVLLRPIGNVVYFMPPYIVDEAEMDLMVQVAADGIELATCD